MTDVDRHGRVLGRESVGCRCCLVLIYISRHAREVPLRKGLALALSQCVGQGALILVIPVLTRLFPPAEMGVYQIALAAAMIAQPLATLKLELVIPTASQVLSRHYMRLAVLACAIVVAFSLTVAIGFYFRGSRDSAAMAAMCAMLVLTLAWLTVDSAILIRRGEIRRLILRNCLGGLLSAGAQLVLALATGSVMSLAVGMLLGRAIAIILTRSRAEPAELANGDLTGVAPQTILRRVYAIASSFLANASGQLPTVYLGGMYGAVAAGHVGVARRVTGTPFSLMGVGLSQYTQSVAAPYIKGGLPGLGLVIRRQMVWLGLVSILFAAMLIAFAPAAAPWVLGDAWAPAGVVIAILAVPFSLQLLMSPVMPVLVMLGFERKLLILQVVRFPLPILATGSTFVLGGGFIAACIALSVSLTINYTAGLVVLLRAIHQRDRGVELSC